MHAINNYRKENGSLDFDRLYKELQLNVDLRYINESENGDLRLYDYSKSCTYERAWNDATRISRGLVLDVVAKELVVLPFEKFFNRGDEHNNHGRSTSGAEPSGYFEKMDGSCVFIYCYKGEWYVNTRGSFCSEQAIKGKEILNDKIDTKALNPDITYIGEVIYRENKIVVDYGDREEIVLTGAYNRVTLEEIDIFDKFTRYGLEHLGFKYPNKYVFASPSEAYRVAKTLPKNEEGFVLLWSNGVREKMKGDEYCHFHGLLSYHTPLFLWRAFRGGGEDLVMKNKKDVPEELWDEYDEWVSVFKNNLTYLKDSVKSAYSVVKHLSDKDLGNWISHSDNNNPYKKFLFTYRKEGETFGTVGTRTFEKLCNLFKPNANNIKVLGDGE